VLSSVDANRGASGIKLRCVCHNLSLLIFNSHIPFRQYGQPFLPGLGIDQPQQAFVLHISELCIIGYRLPGVEELAFPDLEGEGKRSLTRRLQPVEVFFALQLDTDPSDFNRQLNYLPADLNEKISILIDWSAPARPVGDGSGKVGALNHDPDYAPVPVDLIQQPLSRCRHEISAGDDFYLYRFRV